MRQSLVSTLGSLLMGASIGWCTPVCANTIDYNSLESLFGEPITTSVTGTPQRASEVAANMTIITADQIRQSGSRKLPEILQRVPGLDILQTSANSYEVGVRGFQQPYQPRLLVLLDGRQVFIDDYSRTVWENIPVNIDDIRQIEVVKGASSALFGSNAAGGVINIITYNPLHDKNNVVSGTFGTQNSFSGDGTATVHVDDKLGLKISAGGMESDPFYTDTNTTDFVPAFNPSHSYVNTNAVAHLSPDLDIFSGLSYSRSFDNPVFPQYYREGQEMTTYSAQAGFAWQSPIGMIKNNTNFYSSSNRFSTLGTPAPVVYPFTTNLLVSNFEDQFKLGSDHTARVYFEYRHKHYDATDYPQAIPQTPTMDQDVLAFGGTWLWQITDQLSWTNALRFDHEMMEHTGTSFADSYYKISDYDKTLQAFSANSGLVYKPTKTDTLRASYGRGIQLPSFVQNSFTQTIALGGGAFYDIEGNPNISPTIVQNVELGYDRDIQDINSLLRTSIYFEDVSDITGFLNSTSPARITPSGALILSQSTNVGGSKGYGAEIQLKGKHPTGFRWDTSYSFARVVDSDSVSSTVGYDGSAPKHHARLSAGYTTGSWEFDGAFHILSGTNMYRAVTSTVAARTPVDGYTSFDGRIGYSITDNVTMALAGTNLFEETTKESPYPDVERQILMTLTGKF